MRIFCYIFTMASETDLGWPMICFLRLLCCFPSFEDEWTEKKHRNMQEYICANVSAFVGHMIIAITGNTNTHEKIREESKILLQYIYSVRKKLL